MIFVTVGTHEQPFDRLVKYMDRWAGAHDEEVVMQTGFSEYEPQNCTWRKLFRFDEMAEQIAKARIVITHGGPSSFLPVIQSGKTPIVVPRQFEFHEHVNDHQLVFCRELKRRGGNLIVVENIEELGDMIARYDEAGQTGPFKSHNAAFCEEFEKIVDEVMG